MAYNEQDELRDDLKAMNKDDILYENPTYTHTYDTFYERRDDTMVLDEDENAQTSDSLMAADVDPATAAEVDDAARRKRLEEGFGETINPETNPHVSDQLEDNHLNREAEADYKDNSEAHHESIIDKAKNKLDEWTNKH